RRHRAEPERGETAYHDHGEEHGEHALVALEQPEDGVPRSARRSDHGSSPITIAHAAPARPDGAAPGSRPPPARARGRPAAPSPRRRAGRRSEEPGAARRTTARRAPRGAAARRRWTAAVSGEND